MCAQRLLAGLLLLGGVIQCPLRAQTNAAKAAHTPDRYLLIVETSKSMQRRADAVLGSVWYLLGSGLNGQFRDGGTLGVWTFNQDLSAGIFPLQTWSSSAQKDITQRTITFLKGQKYEKRANFDEVAPALSRVIEASEVITVILISSGDFKIRGTPFDDRINAAYLQFRDQQQKARMPFVTVLRARHGEVVDYIVNTPPWPLQMPRLIEESRSVEAPRGKPSEALQNAPPTTVPPLIVSGKKPKPEPAVVSRPEPAAAKVEPPPPVVAGAVTNEPAVGKRPEPAASPAEVARVEPAPVVPAKPVTEPVPAPKPASEPKTETVKSPEAKATESVPSKTEALASVVAGAVTNEPAVVKRPEPAASPAEVARVEPALVVPAKPAAELIPKPAPEPKPVSEPKTETVKAPEARVNEPAPVKPEPVPPPLALAPKPGPALAKAEPLPPAVTATVAKEPAQAKRPEPAVPPVEVARVEPTPVVPAKPATEPTPKPVPAPKSVGEPKSEIVKAPEAMATEPAAAKPEAVSPLPAAKPKPGPTITEQSKPSPSPGVKTGPAPAPATIPEALPATTSSAVTEQGTTSNSSSLTPLPASRPEPSAQSATAAPGESLMRTRNLWIAAVLLAVVAVGFAFLLTRRSRPAPQGSLITRSFEREKGP
jgi:hypothetical protein